ncbi:hypothetical protein N9L26_02165 [Candidatus Pacebacteria bacterium]|nr:hypothetical protein [Candidatus Paceibacterota bacterium]
MKRKGRGEITKVSDLFAKYRNTLKAPEGSVIKEFCAVVEEVLDINVAKEQVAYSPYNKTLAIKKNGPLKTEIKLHEAELIAHLKGRLGEKTAPQTII